MYGSSVYRQYYIWAQFIVPQHAHLRFWLAMLMLAKERDGYPVWAEIRSIHRLHHSVFLVFLVIPRVPTIFPIFFIIFSFHVLMFVFT